MTDPDPPQVVYEKLAKRPEPPAPVIVLHPNPPKFVMKTAGPKLAAYYGSRACPSLGPHRKIHKEMVDKSLCNMIYNINKSGTDIVRSKKMMRDLMAEEVRVSEKFQSDGYEELANLYRDNFQLHFALAFRQTSQASRTGMMPFLQGFGLNHDLWEPEPPKRWCDELVGLLTALEDPDLDDVKKYTVPTPEELLKAAAKEKAKEKEKANKK